MPTSGPVPKTNNICEIAPGMRVAGANNSESDRNEPARISMKQTDKGGGRMKDSHRDKVQELAFLKWQLTVNESARESGIITVSMYEFARDTLKKDIAALELLCYNLGGRGGNSGIETCEATA